MAQKIQNKINWLSASAIVISCMIGTGVFTSLGFQLAEVQNTWSIILMWSIGGVLSLAGALAYSELGTTYPETGGDYIFLSRIFHPLLGYLYSWTSLIVGFSVPIALAAIAMSDYLSPFGFDNSKELMVLILIVISLLHSRNLEQSAWFQNYSTIFKIVFILFIIIIGFASPSVPNNALVWDNTWVDEVTTGGFAVSLIYVSYAFVGWNSSAYIVGEIENPAKNLPKSLIISTILVTILYILVQLVFLRQGTLGNLHSKVEVAIISMQNVLGSEGVKWVSFAIAFQLLATISGYTWIGPRMTFAMAQENKLWAPLAVTNKYGIPVRAIWLQTGLAIIYILTGTFDFVLTLCGFVLQIMSTISVLAVFFIDRKKLVYKNIFHPWLTSLYIIFSIWIVAFVLVEKPIESLMGLTIIVIGVATYYLKR